MSQRSHLDARAVPRPIKGGYGGKRILVRYSLLDDGLKMGESLATLNRRVGWNVSYCKKIGYSCSPLSYDFMPLFQKSSILLPVN